MHKYAKITTDKAQGESETGNIKGAWMCSVNLMDIWGTLYFYSTSYFLDLVHMMSC